MKNILVVFVDKAYRGASGLVSNMVYLAHKTKAALNVCLWLCLVSEMVNLDCCTRTLGIGYQIRVAMAEDLYYTSLVGFDSEFRGQAECFAG